MALSAIAETLEKEPLGGRAGRLAGWTARRGGARAPPTTQRAWNFDDAIIENLLRNDKEKTTSFLFSEPFSSERKTVDTENVSEGEKKKLENEEERRPS